MKDVVGGCSVSPCLHGHQQVARPAVGRVLASWLRTLIKYHDVFGENCFWKKFWAYFLIYKNPSTKVIPFVSGLSLYNLSGILKYRLALPLYYIKLLDSNISF